ncbi:n(G),N(G)-dimethylarginine dimethylaminohydrolase 1 [Trichonephila inaurata madagascariensis]|uniref:N(G),N(G)-dimethylarginine dimethylaminohydrolase 1 n=1 Tax=Trichonephila inaurata madagascariensis TaxID=2747483 RepID=A0A8X6M7D2_9ARAC|nr:n(G),N(G)-dimethylarginine dimethylaminohydrolase 1 [Trichonephila inaurata madagascariensis]
MAARRCTHAIVSRIPDCFKTNAAELCGEIDLPLARKQHEELRKVLRDLGVDVIELPPDESQPDCVFVEDTAIVCNGTALICRPGLPTRQKEVDIVRSILKKDMELPIVDIANPEAMVDGGDILFTGKEFFVGLSKRTNDAGARAVADAFPEYPVTPVKVPGKHHLKSLLSIAGPDIICVSASDEAQSVLKRMAQEATYRYQTVTVPDPQAANCLFVNGTLIHRSEFPNSTKVFEDKIDFNKVAIPLSELSKAGGDLSSCCILIRKSKYIKKL